MSGLFESISNEILELTQDLSEKVDQGIDYLLGASSSAETGKTGADADNFDPDDDNMPGNPLQGITETVLGEIMDSQVRRSRSLSFWAGIHPHNGRTASGFQPCSCLSVPIWPSMFHN